MPKPYKTRQQLIEEIESLNLSLAEARDTLSAIQNGEVDALVLSTEGGAQVYTLTGAEHPYRIMVETMNEGAATVDPEGMIVYCNQRFAEMVNTPLERVIGTPINRYIAPADRRKFKSLVKPGSGVSRNAELLFQTERGESLPVLLAISSFIPIDSQEMICIVAADLTEQKKNEQIVASERLAGLIFEQTTEAFVVCDGEGVIIRFSAEAQNLAQESLYFCNFDEVFRLKSSSEEEEYFSISKVMKGEVYRKTEFNQSLADGRVRDLLLSAGPLRREDEIIGCVIVMIDITERRKFEEELQARTVQLEQMNRGLEAFTYSVSHDLQAPLRAMDGFAGMILKDYGESMDSEFRRKFQVIRDNAWVMQKLIEGLLNLSRIGRQTISFSALDVKALFEGVREELQAANPKRKMKFIIGDIQPAYGDRALIRQVVFNLMSNAVKFTGQRKEAVIEVGSRAEKASTVFYVKDNGAGFDKRYVKKLFGVFQRLHSASEYEGTGIGLAIVQRIIQRHGGRVWAEGEVGKGAVFYFSLPRQKSRP